MDDNSILNDYISQTININKYDKKQILKKLKKLYPTNTHNLNINLEKLKNLFDKRNKTNQNNIRNMSDFKQKIYLSEVNEIIDYIKDNIDNLVISADFTAILFFVAKRRKIIEILKLNPDYMLFGTIRKEEGEERMYSLIQKSRGNHLINKLQTERNRTTNIRDRKELNNHAFTYNGIKLTSLNSVVGFTMPWLRKYGKWIHTKSENIIKLLLKMNKLYKIFITSNVKSKRLLSKLYWVYMQTCPFVRGSASIGEIIFSALLQKYFGCNFKIYEEEVRPEIIPDIHALSYNLKKFQDIFWEQFTTCQINKRNNNNHNQMNPNFWENET